MPAKPHMIAALCAVVVAARAVHPGLHAPTVAHAGSVADRAFEGAWREVQVRLTRRDGRVILVHPVASLYVATTTHYSKMATLAPSDTGKVPTCDNFWGNAGRYELTHDTLTLYPIVGRDARLVAGSSMRFHVRARGDTLWLKGRYNEHYLPIDGSLVPDSAGPFLVQEILLVKLHTLAAAPTRSQASRAPAAYRAGAFPPGGYEGVWREVQVRVTLKDSAAYVVHQEPSLSLATKSHYPGMGTQDATPCGFYGNSGRYEQAGDTLTFHPIVGRVPGLPSRRFQVRVREDTLWLTRLGQDDFLFQEILLVRLAR